MAVRVKSSPAAAHSWGTLFLKEDKKKRTILIPNLTPESNHFSKLALEKEGYRGQVLPLADAQAVQLGKQFVHNDI